MRVSLTARLGIADADQHSTTIRGTFPKDSIGSACHTPWQQQARHKTHLTDTYICRYYTLRQRLTVADRGLWFTDTPKSSTTHLLVLTSSEVKFYNS